MSFFVKITKDGKEVNDAKIKAKFFYARDARNAIYGA